MHSIAGNADQPLPSNCPRSDAVSYPFTVFFFWFFSFKWWARGLLRWFIQESVFFNSFFSDFFLVFSMFFNGDFLLWEWCSLSYRVMCSIFFFGCDEVDACWDDLFKYWSIFSFYDTFSEVWSDFSWFFLYKETFRHKNLC